MADPGFPRGGRQLRGHYLLLGIIFAENGTKMETNWTGVGDGGMGEGACVARAHWIRHCTSLIITDTPITFLKKRKK